MQPLKIMTFNIRGSLFGMDEENIWENRANLNIATIQRHDPDLIGFQELQSGNLAAYEQSLPQYDYELGMRTIDQGEFYHYLAIFWKRERFEKLDCGAFYLSTTPHIWSLDWDSSLVRGATWVRLRDRQTGVTFIHLNSHLDHIGEEARVEGAKLIVRTLTKLSEPYNNPPLVVTGDFNSPVRDVLQGMLPEFPPELATVPVPPAGTVHSVFMDAGFKDTYLEAGHQDEAEVNTYHGFKGEQFPEIGLRIDWILTHDGGKTGWQVESCGIIYDAEPPLYPSDHYPVMAEVRFIDIGE